MSSPALNLLQGDPSTWGVPAVGKTFVGINASGQLVTKQHDGTIDAIVSGAPAYTEQVNASGTTTVIPLAPTQTSVVAISGAARAVPIVISQDGAVDGGELRLLLQFAAVASLVITIYDDEVGSGNIIDTFTTDGSILNGTWFLYYAAGQWNLQMSKVPAY